MPELLKSKLNSTSKPWLLKSQHKENHSLLPDKTLRDNSQTTNKPSTYKRRERKTPQTSLTQPHQEKNKRKLNVNHGELNTAKIANTDNKKSQSSDKLKKSSLPSYQMLRFTSKRDHPTDFKNIIKFLLSINNFFIFLFILLFLY